LTTTVASVRGDALRRRLERSEILFHPSIADES
jgi:hypothetical protein